MCWNNFLLDSAEVRWPLLAVLIEFFDHFIVLPVKQYTEVSVSVLTNSF